MLLRLLRISLFIHSSEKFHPLILLIAIQGLIDFSGADIRNAKGLPALHEPNEYLEGLKSFSESIKRQFKAYNIPPEEVKPIEESVRQLVEEVESLQKPEEIDEMKKKNNIQSINRMNVLVILAILA